MRPASLVELAQARRLEEECARPVAEYPRERGERREKVRIRNQGIRRAYAERGNRRCAERDCDEYATKGISYCVTHASEKTAREGSRLHNWKMARGL